LIKLSKADEAANGLRGLILERKILPGAHINISQLSKQFKISTIPIREALKRLIAEGLVVHKPNVGYAVRNLTLHEYLQVCEVHEALELYLIQKMANINFLVDFDKLERLNLQMKDALSLGDQNLATKANNQFHYAIYENYPNSLFVKRLEETWEEVRPQRNIMYGNPLFTNNIFKEHCQIIQALESGDPEEARKAMEQHYASGRDGAILSFPVAPEPRNEQADDETRQASYIGSGCRVRRERGDGGSLKDGHRKELQVD